MFSGVGPTRVPVVVIGSICIRGALVAALGQVVRVGTVGAVVGCVLRQAHRVDVLDVVEGVGGKVQELVDGHFADQLIPTGIVEVSALQVVQVMVLVVSPNTMSEVSSSVLMSMKSLASRVARRPSAFRPVMVVGKVPSQSLRTDK